LGWPTREEVAWHPEHALGARVWDTQWAVFMGDIFAWRLLRQCGVEVDVLAAHSFGEYPMLVAAGALSFRDSACAAKARADALEAHPGASGGLVSLGIDIASAESLVETLNADPTIDQSGGLWVSAHNAPGQTVIGGTCVALDVLERVCEERRIACRRLAVSRAYHTPLLSPVADALASTIASLQTAVPVIPSFSATHVSSLDTAESIRHSLIAQVTSPVRWVETIRALYDSGVRTFIEVGPASVLSGLIRQVLAHDPDLKVIGIDGRVRAQENPIDSLLERLAAAGLSASSGLLSAPQFAGGEIIRFDATENRRRRNRDMATRSAPQPIADVGCKGESDELRLEILNFVIEGFSEDH
jgi:acyl transferase domain-containing protein